jgi:hypothetical protein
MTEQFDWISAREKCSPGVVFERLKREAKKDVQQRIHALGESSRHNWTVDADRDSFSVVREHKDSQHRAVVTFCLDEDQQIRAYEEHGGKTFFRATLTLTDEGECKLKDTETGKEMCLWQARKIALEKLLFDAPTK